MCDKPDTVFIVFNMVDGRINAILGVFSDWSAALLTIRQDITKNVKEVQFNSLYGQCIRCVIFETSSKDSLTHGIAEWKVI